MSPGVKLPSKRTASRQHHQIGCFYDHPAEQTEETEKYAGVPN